MKPSFATTINKGIRERAQKTMLLNLQSVGGTTGPKNVHESSDSFDLSEIKSSSKRKRFD